MARQTSYQVAQALTSNPYGVKASHAFIDTTTSQAVFCYESTYDRIAGIKELMARGVFRKDMATFSLDKAFKFRFRVAINC
jgi:hypothetical protein